jgi:regulator of replication initiation timing
MDFVKEINVIIRQIESEDVDLEKLIMLQTKLIRLLIDENDFLVRSNENLISVVKELKQKNDEKIQKEILRNATIRQKNGKNALPILYFYKDLE